METSASSKSRASIQSVVRDERNKSLEVVVSLSLNLVSSIAIIQVNKHIYINYGFPNMTLTCLNFVITFLGLLVCNQFGVYKIVRVPIIKMLPMAVSFCGFVVLTNFSLEFNSIGTYQCLKALTTPGVMIISAFFYNELYSIKVKLSVVPVMLGILFNSMYDLNFSLAGLVIGILGALVTSLYQVWIKEKQKQLKIDALQLLTYQSPLSAALLFLIIPFYDHASGMSFEHYFDRSGLEWFFILVSGVMAFMVNLSTYWIIGITSALTYNMAGNIKFCLIILIGAFLFKEPMKLEQLFAILLVTIGLVLYSIFKIKENKSLPIVTSDSSSTVNLLTSTNEPNRSDATSI